MRFRALSRFVFAASVLCFGVSASKADTIYSSTVNKCCFEVDLHQVNANSMQVTVSLTDGAQYFVSTGAGNHPGFAFNLAGDPTVSVSSISSPWSHSDVNLSHVSTNGPSMGTFDYFIDNPGNGASAHNDGPLVFTIFDASGISYSDFVANSKGYFFAADIMDAAGNTGMAGINTPGDPGTPAVPEPSSLALFGTGIVGVAGMLRRRLFRA